MKVIGIIAEYNPFHNGHKYMLDKAKRLSGADFAVIVMSGDFTQRGAPAIYDKKLRTEMALKAGADIVIEMPVFGAVSSAADFAKCGVATLNATGVIDELWFGSESGDIDLLKSAAESGRDESPEVSDAVKKYLREGMTWPEAVSRAHGEDGSFTVSSPNDILGVEYIRALNELDLKIVPHTVKRAGSDYHSEDTSGRLASAEAVRKVMTESGEKSSDTLLRIMPESSLKVIDESGTLPVVPDDFSILLNAKLRTLSPEELISISQMPEPVARKLYNGRLTYRTFSELNEYAKDRQYTYTRISRALMNLILGITAEETGIFKSTGSAPWIRILGLRKDASKLMSAVNESASRPIIVKTAEAKNLPDGKESALFGKNLETSDIYRLIQELKTGRRLKNEYESPAVFV